MKEGAELVICFSSFQRSFIDERSKEGEDGEVVMTASSQLCVCL